MKKKVLSLMLATALAITALAGCGGQQEEAVRLADKILFLNGHPSHIEQMIEIPLTIQQRTSADEQMKILELKESIKKELFGTE